MRSQGPGLSASVLTIALIVVTGPRPASAEQPWVACSESWWVETSAPPGRIEAAAERPWIYLRVQWSDPSTSVSPSPEGFPGLEVEVVDDTGRIVPGTLTAGAEGLGRDLRATPRWRPDGPLEPGRVYTVGFRADAMTTSRCHYSAVTGAVEVVALEPRAETPSVTLEVFTREGAPQETLTGSDCDDRPDIKPCPDVPDACCHFTPYEGYFSHTVAALIGAGALAAHPRWYLIVDVRAEHLPGITSGESSHPAREGDTWTYTSSLLFVPGAAPAPPPWASCVTVTVTDVFTERQSVVTACADPDRHVSAPPAGQRTCDPDLCLWAVDPPIDRPVEADPDGHAHADPEPRTRGTSGCHGGPHPNTHWLVLGALGIAIGSRRGRPAAMATRGLTRWGPSARLRMPEKP